MTIRIDTGTRLGPYEIVSRIGAGGMGEVFRARDTRLERQVAIKVLPAALATNEQFRARFEREAKAISQLNHPHICTLYDVGENYIVMELLEGESLADRLARGPLSVREMLKYAVQIADALDRAHRAGIVHRDLKPGNVMITRSGAKLLDFGLATSTPSFSVSADTPDDTTQHKPLTEEGAIVGTLQYMAPEQLEGLRVDHRADIFAFGAVMYEMITGRRAFEGKTRASLIAAVLEHEPLPMSELQPSTPSALDRLIRTCLDKDPDDRWQSAHDVKRELEWIQTGLSSPAETAQKGVGRRSQVRLVSAIILIAAVAALAGWFAATGRRSQPERRIVSSIVPPDKTHFVVTGDAAGPVTLSPDGRHATFVALGPQGAMLWLQALETGLAVPLRGTEKAMFPFWSPDSRSIGFFASAKLMVTDIDGSSSRVIAEAPDGRGGCWGPGGEILFTPFTRAPLYRVPAGGGTPVAVTRVDPPYTTHRWPAFLPDGKHFVFLAANHSDPSSADTAIFMAPREGGPIRKLIASPSSAIPFGDHLILAEGSKLVARRLTAQGLEGPRTTLWSNALTDPGTWRTVASVSSNGLLATYSSSATTQSRLVWVDRSGKELGEIAPDAVYRDVALSPDGTKVAVAIGDPLSTIYLHDVVRGVRSRFSFVTGPAFNPVWTPDGVNVIFVSLVSTDHYGMYIKPADGRMEERKIVKSSQQMRPSGVAPDGRVLYDAESDIVAIPLTGGSPSTVIRGAGQQNTGTVSPDGRWIVYSNADSTGRAAFVAPYPALGAKWQVSSDVISTVMWGARGREILYLSADGQVKSVAVSVRGNSIDLGTPVPLFRVNVNTNRRSIAAAADGSRFLIIDPRLDELGVATLVTHFDLPLK